ncbi:hypothetical protein SAMN05216551_102409 [Chitinasiproducens palmae]|uniref:Uncharacterized protein n=1 Tax=Chitinasiproducens palmae TaxID=1770053 RepID=A0A1H2PL96_9BURK|nr:hypothetical protein SAMN05216551_102409 [Chitinasiproducens palmae]
MIGVEPLDLPLHLQRADLPAVTQRLRAFGVSEM